MKTLYVVVASGGSYEDYWERNIRAFDTEAEADALIAKYEAWLTELRNKVYPESCQEYNVQDEENEREWELLWDRQQEFDAQYFLSLGIPKEDEQFMRENMDSSYDCDRPSYHVTRLEYQES